jgi:hypothetical protein
VKILLISYLGAVCFIVAFLADYLPFVTFTNKIVLLTRSSVRTMRSAMITDADKEKILLANSMAVFTRSVKLTGLTLLVLIIGCLLLFLTNVFKISDGGFLLRYLETMHGLALSLISFTAYFLVKKIYVRIRL